MSINLRLCGQEYYYPIRDNILLSSLHAHISVSTYLNLLDNMFRTHIDSAEKYSQIHTIHTIGCLCDLFTLWQATFGTQNDFTIDSR